LIFLSKQPTDVCDFVSCFRFASNRNNGFSEKKE
jgi:hypothetical protein